MSSLPSPDKDLSAWYQAVIDAAQLAETSPVRGAMVIRPYGYAIWENITKYLDERIKATGHQNAAFPLLIPESFLKKEAQHVEGFAPELAVVTHAGGKELEEPLVVRPTSETIIHYFFAKWIKSWRDLPLKINQWASVIRWEMRPRPFLRTTEIFWQEGHTAHETYEQAMEEVLMMLDEYVTLAQDVLAIPVVSGLKSESEKFPGADKTYTFEGLMPDGKALQMGTSHLLSQSFAQAFEMVFQNQEGLLAHPFLTSWAITTRLVGAVIMVHGDDRGLVLPPRIAPIQVVIIPIVKKGDDLAIVENYVKAIHAQLLAVGIKAYIDSDDSKTPGAKFFHWEVRGVPLRIEVGARDIASDSVVVVNRVTRQKSSVPTAQLAAVIPTMLEEFHAALFKSAQEKRAAMWHKSAKLSEFGSQLREKQGFYQTGWCGKQSCEALLKEYQASTRVLLAERTFEECFNCSDRSLHDVLVAKAY